MKTHTNTGHFDIVESVMEHLDPKVVADIVRQHITSTIRDTVRQRSHDEGAVLLSTVAEKLQRKMLPEAATKFHQTLLEQTGIDARRPMFNPAQYAVNTPEQILRLAEFYEKNRRS